MKAGAVDPRGYIRICYNNKLYWAHRLIYAWHTGEFPKIVDHVDRNKRNNKIENLRKSDKSDNTVNSSNVWGAVPYRGVYFNKSKNKYHVTFKKKSLGYFRTAEEAAARYNIEYERNFNNG